MITHPPQRIILAKSAVAIVAPAGTAEETLVTVTIPGKLLGPNGSIEVEALHSMTNNANGKTMRVRFGGTSMGGQNVTNVAAWHGRWKISNKGAMNSQVCNPFTAGSGGWNTSSAAPATAAIDTSQDAILTITMQKGTGTDTVTLEDFEVAVVPRA